MQSKLIGVMVLSGGKGRRIAGQDKGWCEYQNASFIEQVVEQLQSQLQQLPEVSNLKPARQLFISANRFIEKYQSLGLPVIVDHRSGFLGPLSGIESVMQVDGNSSKPTISRWITYPVDSPKVPSDYLRLMSAVSQDKIGVLKHQGRWQFAYLSIPAKLQSSLTAYLDSGARSIKGWLFQAALAPLIQEIDCEGLDGELLNLNR